MSKPPAPFAISTAEILEALAAAAPPDPERPPGVFTGPEIREAAGWSQGRFARVMPTFAAAGLIELVPFHRIAVDGRNARIIGYRFLKKAKPTKKAA